MLATKRLRMQSLWMLFATFVFAIMGVCVKLASATCSTSEIVMSRGLVGMVLIAIMLRFQKGTLRTTLPWHHAWRGFVGVTALWLWFFSIGKLNASLHDQIKSLKPSLYRNITVLENLGLI